MNTTTMKRHPAILATIILTATMLAGCKGDVLDYRNVQIANGKIFAGSANSPFSGTVTNVPNGQILASQRGFQSFVKTVETVLPNVTVNYLDAVGLEFISTDPDAPSAVYCDVHANEGYLDGHATCKGANSDEVRMDMTFKGGRLDGTLTVYDTTGGKTVLAEAAFANGALNGKQTIYSPATHKLVHATNWANGTLDGTEEGFDENTGNLILHATLTGGKYDGKFTRYAPDGQTVLSQSTFSNGVEIRDASPGQPAGQLSSASDINACVDGWTAAYHRERGDDALIATDQLGEWRLQCECH